MLIETVNTGNAFFPQIAFDANGNALAVWLQYDNNTSYVTKIWANRYTVGSGWGVAAVIETKNAVNTGSTPNPQIAMDAYGNGLAVWHKSDGTRNNIWYNRYTAGTGWGTAALLESDNVGNAEFPMIVMGANGNALVVWNQFDGIRSNIYSKRYTVGNGWSTRALIETNNAGSTYSPPKIALDASGNAIAVWYQYDGTRTNIWSNRYAAGTGWGTAARIETDNAGNAYNPQIAVDASGNALAVWVQNDANLVSHIWYNRYTVGTGWGTATILDAGAVNVSDIPRIAIDTNGNALVVWYQNLRVRSNRYTAGTGWGSAEPVETDDTASIAESKPQIAFDANGNAMVVWNKSDGARNNIWYNRYTAGTGWGTAALLESDNTGDASDPQIAIDANGDALAVWSQRDATTAYNIWSNRYR